MEMKNHGGNVNNMLSILIMKKVSAMSVSLFQGQCCPKIT